MKILNVHAEEEKWEEGGMGKEGVGMCKIVTGQREH